MHNYCASPTVINSKFNGNDAYEGGGMYNYWCDNYYGIPKLTNCLFFENESEVYGGASYNYYSHPVLTNCTIADNEAGYGYYGGAVCNDHSSPMLTNCILWDNTTEIYNTNNSCPVVRYSCVEGGYTGHGSEGTNIGSDPSDNPSFADADNDDYSISSDSPCIDEGDSGAIYHGVDIDYNPRKINDPFSPTDTGKDAPDAPGVVVDMGAYEYQSLWYSADSKISGGEAHSMLNKTDRSVWTCGYNSWSQMGTVQGIAQLMIPVSGGDTFSTSGYLENIVFIDAGWKHSLAIDKGAHVWAWGTNTQGQIGNTGIEADSLYPEAAIAPVQVENGEMTTDSGYIENIVQVAAGRSGEYSLALDGDGNVWAWGNNNGGQLGDGNQGTDATTPVQVVDYQDVDHLENIVDIDAGVYHSIALEDTANDYVWCWGSNSYGQLGNGTTTDSDKPVKVQKKVVENVSDLTGIIDVAVCCGYTMYEHGGASFALDSSGYVWAWGSGDYGKLGQGNSQEKDWATKISALDSVTITAISAGDHHVLALDDDNKVWAWGWNYYGQLGDGTVSTRSTPVQVLKVGDVDLTDIVYIDAGFMHSTAIDNQDRVWVWGRNEQAQLGLGETYLRQLVAKQMPVD